MKNNIFLDTEYVGIAKNKQEAFIVITQSKKDFIETYTLRARIGIYIGVLVGLIKLNLNK